MNKSLPKRIRIIGSVGSGKTTFARQLSKVLHIPVFELDNVVWKRHKSGDIRRTEQERVEYLNSIIQSTHWIIEGVHNEDWVADSFLEADLIILLDPKYSIRTYRIIKRYVKQKLRIESSNYKPTFPIFLKMFKWNRYFEKFGKPNFFSRYGCYNDRIIVLKSRDSIKKYLNQSTRGSVEVF